MKGYALNKTGNRAQFLQDDGKKLNNSEIGRGLKVSNQTVSR